MAGAEGLEPTTYGFGVMNYVNPPRSPTFVLVNLYNSLI